MILSAPVSIFPNAKNPVPSAAVPMERFLASKKWAGRVEAVRAETDKARRAELKKAMPAATISGVFAHRSAGQIVAYNGCVCLDFDADDNPGLTPGEMRRLCSEASEVAYAGLSIGGGGVFAIVPTDNTDPAMHGKVVELLGDCFLSLGLTYDKACKDVCRLRFVSYDTEAYYNHTAVPFSAQELLPMFAAPQTPPRPISPAPPRLTVGRKRWPDMRTQVEAYIAAINSGCADIAPGYDDWLKLGLALVAEFGAGGEDYFQQVSQYSPKYDPTKTAKKYAELLRSGSRRFGIGTFFHFCHAYGIRL